MKAFDLEYRATPFSTRKLSYLIAPRHLISLEDLALMIKTDSIYKISHAVVSKQLPLYYYKKSNQDGDMLCFPMFFRIDFELEYKLYRQRIFFLKRDVLSFFDSNKDVTVLDSILKIPYERIATKDNIKSITENIITRMCATIDAGQKSFLRFYFESLGYSLIMLVTFLKWLFFLPIEFCGKHIKSNEYSTKLLIGYDGTTLLSFTLENAKTYIEKALEDNNIKNPCTWKSHTALRSKLAFKFDELGLSREDIGNAFNYSREASPESRDRIIRGWIQDGRTEKTSAEKSAVDKSE